MTKFLCTDIYSWYVIKRQSCDLFLFDNCTIIGIICTLAGMEIKNLYEPFALELLETDTYVARKHKKTFFEMVFILEGDGVQTINQNTLPYSANKLFLIFPNDSHGFEVHHTTRFFFIRFNEHYLQNQGKEWIRKMELIFYRHNHSPGCILKNIADKPLIRSLVEALVLEISDSKLNPDEVVGQLINTIITIAARNISLQYQHNGFPATHSPSSLVYYVQENIFNPERLKATEIAASFNVSPTYISEYFKKQSGENLQQYIINYKIKLMETRLLFTDMRIGEIAEEFGFTDESHLHRIFKKYKGTSPSAFRKQGTH